MIVQRLAASGPFTKVVRDVPFRMAQPVFRVWPVAQAVRPSAAAAAAYFCMTLAASRGAPVTAPARFAPEVAQVEVAGGVSGSESALYFSMERERQAPGNRADRGPPQMLASATSGTIAWC